MDNPAFHNDEGVPTRHPRKPLARANSTLTPTTKSWHLTQAPRAKLCRCNSVLTSKDCCADNSDPHADGPTSLDYPFFANKSPTKNILCDNSLWTKEFWSDSFSRLHDTSPPFLKFPASKSGVATIYDPQFLSSKFGYSGTHRSGDGSQGGQGPRWHSPTHQRLLALLCALLLTLLAAGNILYIFRTVEKPVMTSSNGNWVDVVLISGEFRITNEPYRETLANSTTEDFQQLAGLLTHQLDSLFSLSVVSEPYHSVAVSELLPATQGLLVRCQVVLRASTPLTASRLGLAFIGGLRNQHGHVWLGNFSVDIQSIGFQATGDAVTWTDWSEWGECQLTQEFGYVQLRSRNCTLRSGVFLYSTLPCLLVRHSHGNIETAPCVPPLTAAEGGLTLIVNVTTPQPQRLSAIKVFREPDRNNTKNQTDSLQPMSTNITSTTELPIKNESVPCRCAADHVCVALAEHSAPQCRPVLDTTDPTGCGGHCKINTQLCQKIQNNAFRCVDDSKCLEDEWQCGNKLCIPQSKRCDGHFNCYDHTDEHNCDCLGAEQFTCNDSQCIPNHRFCDGFPDCKDHSDEPFGCGGECKTHEWRCSNSRCVPQIKRCDRVDDCGDSSDESDCPTPTPE
uniref:SEA domain-containing protein n=1 Tax=Graphocephala atropunctata TaxID=36148 RepID=A0A1B6LW04_9HEMI